jgi:hypothetical protein
MPTCLHQANDADDLHSSAEGHGETVIERMSRATGWGIIALARHVWLVGTPMLISADISLLLKGARRDMWL